VEKIKKTSGLLPIGFIFMTAIGGVFFGLFTPTEGGAFGACGSLAVVIAMRRLTRSGFVSGLRETLHTTVMIMLVILGGFFFTRMLVLSGLMQAVADTLLGMPVPPVIIFLGITLLLIAAGMVMVPVVMLVIFVPIFLPPLDKMGYDPIWFGVMCTRLVELGCITPPIAINLYVVKGVLGNEIEFTEVFQGTIPFIIADLINLVILYFIPGLALWLPKLMI
jgi:TRAP-type C4-dicarboxylate transport system permease large subunit